jgi:hypothetical protein
MEKTKGYLSWAGRGPMTFGKRLLFVAKKKRVVKHYGRKK